MILTRILNNIRACYSPDAMHPCSMCPTTVPHETRREAAEHFKQWIDRQVIPRLNDLLYLLYSRTVEHSLFRTSCSSSGRCPGHFGFCRNQPDAGDEIVLLPGLDDPVVVRRQPESKLPDSYQIISVSSGMLGPPIVNEDVVAAEVNQAFCFGSCPEVESEEGKGGHHQSRSIHLI